MTEYIALFLMLGFLTKHLVVDFFLQPPWMWMNKGTYGHIGGIAHSVLHGVVSLPLMMFFTDAKTTAILALTEVVVHYHIDWAKMNMNRIANWKCDKNPEFWFLLGTDQWFHNASYILMTAIIIRTVT